MVLYYCRDSHAHSTPVHAPLRGPQTCEGERASEVDFHSATRSCDIHITTRSDSGIISEPHELQHCGGAEGLFTTCFTYQCILVPCCGCVPCQRSDSDYLRRESCKRYRYIYISVLHPPSRSLLTQYRDVTCPADGGAREEGY